MSIEIDRKEAAIVISALANEETFLREAVMRIDETEKDVKRLEERCQKLRQIANLLQELNEQGSNDPTNEREVFCAGKALFVQETLCVAKPVLEEEL